MLNSNGAQGAFDYRNIGDAAKLNIPNYNISLTPQKYASAWMSIDEKIVANPDSIAAAGAMDTSGDGKPDRINGLGDNRNALAIADLRHKEVMIEKQSTFGDYYKFMVGEVGTTSETAKVNSDKNQVVVESLENLRKQVSGVNVDEELSKMLMFQHGYNASARLVSTVDRMIETIIRMGA